MSSVESSQPLLLNDTQELADYFADEIMSPASGIRIHILLEKMQSVNGLFGIGLATYNGQHIEIAAFTELNMGSRFEVSRDRTNEIAGIFNEFSESIEGLGDNGSSSLVFVNTHDETYLTERINSVQNAYQEDGASLAAFAIKGVMTR